MSICWSGHVPSSLWPNVSTVKSLLGNSLTTNNLPFVPKSKVNHSLLSGCFTRYPIELFEQLKIRWKKNPSEKDVRKWFIENQRTIRRQSCWVCGRQLPVGTFYISATTKPPPLLIFIHICNISIDRSQLLGLFNILDTFTSSFLG